jgi:dTMP kinase
MQNKYIVFEGIDGCGKSSHSEALVERLQKLGHKAIWTREPGSPLINLKIREFVLGHEKISSASLELLMQADRAEHTTKVKQLLEEGYFVVSDRSFMSGLAYGVACGNQVKDIWNLLSFAIKVFPSNIFLLDIPIKEASKRRLDRGDKSSTREEAKGDNFTEKVRENFLRISKDLNSLSNINGKKFAINRLTCDFLGEIELFTNFPKVYEIDGTLSKEVIIQQIDKEIYG